MQATVTTSYEVEVDTDGLVAHIVIETTDAIESLPADVLERVFAAVRSQNGAPAAPVEPPAAQPVPLPAPVEPAAPQPEPPVAQPEPVDPPAVEQPAEPVTEPPVNIQPAEPPAEVAPPEIVTQPTVVPIAEPAAESVPPVEVPQFSPPVPQEAVVTQPAVVPAQGELAPAAELFPLETFPTETFPTAEPHIGPQVPAEPVAVHPVVGEVHDQIVTDPASIPESVAFRPPVQVVGPVEVVPTS